MSRITVKKLESLTKDNHGEIIREEGGISGRVRAGIKGITVSFRYDYRLEGKKLDYALGTWPSKSLADIRTERNRVRRIIVTGINPKEAEKAQKIQYKKNIKETISKANQERIKKLTVHDLFNIWLQDGVARQDGNKELNRLFSKDVLPIIGTKPLSELNDNDILTTLRQMLKRGVTRQTVIAYNDLNQMLSWGEKRQPWRSLMLNGNPCDLVDIKRLLPPDYEEERDRILSPSEIRELHDIFQCMEKNWLNAPNRRIAKHPFPKKSQIALWICLGTICRIGELLQARWEHVNLDEAVWFIPRENVKGVRNRKQEHYVFLSDFTRRQFLELKEITGTSEWCFPSRNRRENKEIHVCLKSISKQVGDRQVQFKKRDKPLKARTFTNDLVLSNGTNGEWTPHDLRRTGATMMQGLGISLDVIDRCQNHVISGSRVRRHYLHYDYRVEKTEAWQKLGDCIDDILK